MSVPALIALGGNTGDVRATFTEALRTLHGTPGVTVTAASRAYRTPAVGAKAGGEFLNAAATLETALPPHALLDAMQAFEEAAGRDRRVYWGPRPVDLDLVLYGTETVADGRLSVPHPGLAWRRFVLDPACEVAADWPVAGGGTARGLRDALLRRPLPVGVRSRDPRRAAALRAALEPAFPVRLTAWDPDRQYRRRPPALWTAEPDDLFDGPHVVRVPENTDAAVARLRDVLSAALPDPQPEPVGDPLWP